MLGTLKAGSALLNKEKRSRYYNRQSAGNNIIHCYSDKHYSLNSFLSPTGALIPQRLHAGYLYSIKNKTNLSLKNTLILSKFLN